MKKIKDTKIPQHLYTDIANYIDDNLEFEKKVLYKQVEHCYCDYLQEHEDNLDNYLKHPQATFTQELLQLIDSKNLTDVDVYKKAGIDRKLFSKIRSNSNYKPSKITAICLSLALELDLDDMLDFIQKAGYTLSFSSKFDLIIRYFIEKNIFDIFEINDALYAFNQPLLSFNK